MNEDDFKKADSNVQRWEQEGLTVEEASKLLFGGLSKGDIDRHEFKTRVEERLTDASPLALFAATRLIIRGEAENFSLRYVPCVGQFCDLVEQFTDQLQRGAKQLDDILRKKL